VLQIVERTALARTETCQHVTHENPVYSELLLQETQQTEESQGVKEETLIEEELQEVSDLQAR
jgi:hypothetical protein